MGANSIVLNSRMSSLYFYRLRINPGRSPLSASLLQQVVNHQVKAWKAAALLQGPKVVPTLTGDWKTKVDSRPRFGPLTDQIRAFMMSVCDCVYVIMGRGHQFRT